MSRDPFDELEKLRLDVDPDVRDRHMAAIGTALRRRPRPRPRRKWALGVVTAALVAGPVAGVASEGALPGDPLYPVKLTIEPVRALFDSDVVAEHRVAELDGLIETDASVEVIEDQIDVTRDALATVDAPSLEQDFDRLVEEFDRVRRVGHGSDEPMVDEPSGDEPRGDDRLTDDPTGDEPTDATTTTSRESDATTTTTATSDSTTTTTASDSDRDRDRPRDGDSP